MHGGSVVPTSVQHHVRLDVAGCQGREELGEQVGEGVVVPSMLLLQPMVKVEAEIQTAAVNDQATVPELHILEEVSVPLYVGSQAMHTHKITSPERR